MYNRIVDELLPNALMMGVDYNLFWTLDPKGLSPFIKAFFMKQKYEDVMAWQQGLYIRMAIASCLDKSSKYPTKPFMTETVKSETPKQKQARIKQNFMNHAMKINARFGKEN